MIIVWNGWRRNAGRTEMEVEIKHIHAAASRKNEVSYCVKGIFECMMFAAEEVVCVRTGLPLFQASVR